MYHHSIALNTGKIYDRPEFHLPFFRDKASQTVYPDSLSEYENLFHLILHPDQYRVYEQGLSVWYVKKLSDIPIFHLEYQSRTACQQKHL